jgi:parallel beta-helix repeat protein
MGLFGARRGLARVVVLALAAAGTVIAAAPSSSAFEGATLSAGLSTFAGDCFTFDEDDSQSAVGATSFDDEIESNSGGMHGKTSQRTTLTGTSFLTVQSTGSSKMTGSSPGTPGCVPRTEADNDFNINVGGTEPYHFRLAGTVRTTGTGFNNSGTGSGCASISFESFSDSACSPPDGSDTRSISFSRSGLTGSGGTALSFGSGMTAAIPREGGSASSTLSWDITLTLTTGPDTVDCGQPITRSVTLTTDLDCTEDGLIVAFPNITIDLGGHSIVGAGTEGHAGINNAAGHDDVTVRNGTIANFGTGLVFPSADGTRLSGLLVTDSTNDGVTLDNSVVSTVRNITARGNGSDGFELNNCGGCLVKNNLAEGNGADGIELGGGDSLQGSNTLFRNRSQLNGGDGIKIGGSSKLNVLEENKAESNDGAGIVVGTDENVLKTNSAKTNTGDGIRLSGAANNSLRENVSRGNQGNGIAIVGGSDVFPNNVLKENKSLENRLNGFDIGLSTNNHLKSNISKQNQLAGYQLTGASGNRLEGNVAKLNAAISGPFAGDGIVLFESFGNTLTGNLVRQNQSDGLLLEDSDNNIVKGNTAKLNGLDGIEIDPPSSVNDLTNNVANENHDFGIVVSNDTTTGTGNRANDNGLGDCSITGGSSVQCT